MSATETLTIGCSNCHTEAPHRNDRLNVHVQTLACQTCHLPEVARLRPTKVAWDWSTAGLDIPGADSHEYLKIKGSFIYVRRLVPEYRWFNGSVARYLKGDTIQPDRVTELNRPLGDIHDPRARIWPFKVHRGKQPYDLAYRVLLVPKTIGPDGYWKTFDWERSLILGSEASGLSFSGTFGFAETEMVYNLTHMVAPEEQSLVCTDCHSESGRMNFVALGYPGDPAVMGGRRTYRFVRQRGSAATEPRL